jgi:hypothetical protein
VLAGAVSDANGGSLPSGPGSDAVVHQAVREPLRFRALPQRAARAKLESELVREENPMNWACEGFSNFSLNGDLDDTRRK